MEIQSECFFISAMVPGNKTCVHQQASLHQLHHPHPLQWPQKGFLHLFDIIHVLLKCYVFIEHIMLTAMM